MPGRPDDVLAIPGRAGIVARHEPIQRHQRAGPAAVFAAGLGVLDEPLVLTFEDGLLVNAEGKGAAALLKQLGDAPKARNLAELGIGTNDKARFTGVILEDEKICGTVHIALGSNDTFGGTVAAGIHVDGVMRKPTLLLDGRIVVADGLLKVE